MSCGYTERELAIFYCRAMLTEARNRRLAGNPFMARMLLEWAANGRRRVPPLPVRQFDLFGATA